MGTRTRIVVGLALAACAVAAAVTAARAGPGELSAYDRWLPRSGPDDVVSFLVVDEEGKPVEGAKVTQYLHDRATRLPVPTKIGQATSDSHGVVSVRWKRDPQRCHWIVEASGKAPYHAFGTTPGDRITLKPPQGVAGRILDAFGEPAAGTSVDLLAGGENGPAIRSTTTNGGGRFSFPGTDPKGLLLWITGRRVAAEFRPAAAGGDVLTRPGRTVSGTVVAANGKPAEGAVIGANSTRRGPTTVADSKGRFHLVGVRPDADVWTRHASWQEGIRALPTRDDADYSTFGPELRGDGKTRIVFPPEDLDLDEHFNPNPLRVLVRLLDAKTGETVVGVTARLLRKSDRWEFSGRTVDEADDDEPGLVPGVALLAAEPGEYTLVAGGPFESHVAAPETVTVALGPPRAIEIRVTRTSRLEVELADVPDDAEDEFEFLLVVPGASQELDLTDDDPVHLRADVLAAVQVRAEGIERAFAVAPPKDGVRHARIAWSARKEVRIPVELPEDAFVETVRCDEGVVDWNEDEGTIVVLTHVSGDATIRVQLDDSRFRVEPVRVKLPAAPGSRVTSPPAKIVKRTPTRFKVRSSDGKPVEASLKVDEETAQTEEDGTAQMDDVPPGARVEASAADHLPVRGVVAKSGETTLTFPPGRLDVRVTSAADGPLAFSVLVGSDMAFGEDGRVLIRGVPPGEHEVVVSTDEHGSRRARVEVSATEPTRLDVKLP